jgi:hypothetical protein
MAQKAFLYQYRTNSIIEIYFICISHCLFLLASYKTIGEEEDYSGDENKNSIELPKN